MIFNHTFSSQRKKERTGTGSDFQEKAEQPTQRGLSAACVLGIIFMDYNWICHRVSKTILSVNYLLVFLLFSFTKNIMWYISIGKKKTCPYTKTASRTSIQRMNDVNIFCFFQAL